MNSETPIPATTELSRSGADTTRDWPLISVVMPCYNAGPYVTEAVESVMGQKYGNVELIVVDDGSQDGSIEIVQGLAERHPGRIHLMFTPRVGPFPARNVGLRRARGKLIAFLDADDWWLPVTLFTLYTALTEYGADLAYCGWQNVGKGIQSLPYVPPAYEEGNPVEHFLRTCPWPIHGALLTRELVDRIGGFSERRYSAMDYDFWLRALALTPRIRLVPEVLAFYRWHDSGQISSVKWRQVLDALHAQQDFIRANPRLVGHLSKDSLHDLTEGQVLRQAYRAFWKRDLLSAQKLFRHVAAKRSFILKDTRHIVAALLPLSLYRRVVALMDRSN